MARRRKSDIIVISSDDEPSPKKTKTSSAEAVSASHAESSTAGANAAAQSRQQRPTTPDLEFDYDRSQLRDPRPTPGRVKRPRYEDRDLTESQRARFKPLPRPSPRDVSTAFRKTSCSERRHSATRHTTSTTWTPSPLPTYDPAGFELDYDKVDKWMKPQAYNKKRMVKGMEKRVSEAQEFDSRMLDMFFEEGDEAMEKQKHRTFVFTSCVKDKISKDLNIPWHKIGMAELDLWEQKGFPKEKLADWLVFTEEDKKRALKMLGGARLRK
ncbi:uncharacterized protein PG986_012749 [Apiospora aurea]|uniref:Uncharacterized protein n=1 Tax=Apiospora aurea TaxID=335848 RepID=A0ABR1Q0V5_9PEZI